MRVRHLASLAAGLLVAFAVAGLPASAADQSIDAVSNTGWDNPDRTINLNDSVTWTNGTIYDHNVCVRRANVSSGCGEFQEPPTPTHPWPNPVTHQFQSDGTFKYYCQRHPGMTGTITVGSGVNPPVDTGTGTGTGTSTGTGTGTSTTPPPYSQPTDTTTTPTQTQPATVAPDTTKPAFTGTVKRRASRTALIVELNSSEGATLRATVFRRPPRGRSFSRLSRTSLHVKQGKNAVTLIRKLGRRRSGAFRVALQLEDAAGNKSAAKTISFKVA